MRFTDLRDEPFEFDRKLESEAVTVAGEDPNDDFLFSRGCSELERVPPSWRLLSLVCLCIVYCKLQQSSNTPTSWDSCHIHNSYTFQHNDYDETRTLTPILSKSSQFYSNCYTPHHRLTNRSHFPPVADSLSATELDELVSVPPRAFGAHVPRMTREMLYPRERKSPPIRRRKLSRTGSRCHHSYRCSFGRAQNSWYWTVFKYLLLRRRVVCCWVF